MSDSFGTPWTVALRLLCPQYSPGKNTGVGCHFLLQGIFPTQGLNSGLLYWQADSLPLRHQGSHTNSYLWSKLYSSNKPSIYILWAARERFLKKKKETENLLGLLFLKHNQPKWILMLGRYILRCCFQHKLLEDFLLLFSIHLKMLLFFLKNVYRLSESESGSVMSDSANPWTIQSMQFSTRTLEWVAFPFFRGSSQPRDQIQVSCIAVRFFISWSTKEALYHLILIIIQTVRKTLST